jgi:Leucine-rich repeat (LRR) protein
MTLVGPEIGCCTALTWLSLNANQLPVLPPSIGHLTNMVRLSLHINRLEHLPPELGNLVHLEALRWALVACCWPGTRKAGSQRWDGSPVERAYVAGPRFALSTAACPLPAACSLHSNQLPSVPPELGRLTECVRLSLYQNRLTTLPPEIGGMTALQELWLYSNQLTSVPPELGRLTGLKRLWLDRNRLAGVPAELAALTNLQVGVVAGGGCKCGYGCF